MDSVLDDRPLKFVTEFACRACGSPAVVYPNRLSDDAPVKCQRCQTVLCTLREFRLSAEQGVARVQVYADSSAQTRSRSGRRLLDRLFRRLAVP
jgi:transcription elongation factor Elf1